MTPYNLPPYAHDDDLLKAWHAVPSADGELVPIKLPVVGGQSRFLHLGFGDGRIYLAGKHASKAFPRVKQVLCTRILKLNRGE